MLTALTDVILPVLLVAALGAVLAARFDLDQQTLNKVQLYGLVPPLAFSSLMKTTIPPTQIAGLALAYGLVSVVIGVLAWLGSRGLASRTAGSVMACAVIGNNGNFGLPIALLALGQAGLEQAVVIFVFSLVVMWTAGPALLGSHGRPGAAAREILRLPTIWAVVLAVVLRGLGWSLPVGVGAAVDMVAGACVPMVLLSLGIQLARMGRIRWTRAVVTASVLRVVVLPVVAWGVGRVLGLHGVPLQSLVLACSMPTAVNVLMIALEYDSDVETTASAVAVSTVASIATLAWVISALPMLG